MTRILQKIGMGLIGVPAVAVFVDCVGYVAKVSEAWEFGTILPQ